MKWLIKYLMIIKTLNDIQDKTHFNLVRNIMYDVSEKFS